MKEKKQSKVFVVFKADAWFSVCSYNLMGVFGTKEKAIHAIVTKGEFDSDWLEEQDDEDIMQYIKRELDERMQTPLCGDINYIIKEGNFNEWEELV